MAKKYTNELKINGTSYIIKDKELRDYFALDDNTIANTTVEDKTNETDIVNSADDIISVLGATYGNYNAVINNLKMEIGTYRGSSIETSKTIQFNSIIPIIVYIYRQDKSGTTTGKHVSCMMYPNTSMFHEFGMGSSASDYGTVTWSLDERSVTFIMESVESMSMNASATQYYYIAFGAGI